MELDADYLYWVGQGDFEGTGEATVWRMSRVGAGTPELLASLPARAYSLAIDDEFVYVPVTGSGSRVGTTDGAIVRVPKAGGAVETLASGIFNPTSVAVDSGFVYFSVAVSPAGEVWRVAKSGGAPARIADDIDNPWDLAVDDDWLYVSEMNRGQVLRVHKELGERTVLAAGWVGTDWLRAAGGQIYFGGCSSGACVPEDFYSVSSGGGPLEHLMVSTGERGTKVAIGSTFAVWGRYYVPTDGSPAVDLLADGPADFTTMAVAADDAGIYLADILTGTILGLDLASRD
jgi:hypothetical protein